MKNYPHYFKLVKHLTHIDVYRVLDLFKVERASVAHAVKKLLCAGGRGTKNYVQDITEARDSLNRELEMLTEDAGVTVSLAADGSGFNNDVKKTNEFEKFLATQSVPPAPFTTAFDVYPEVSRSQQMVALNGRIVKMIPQSKLVPIKYQEIFDYLFSSLKLYREDGVTPKFLDEAFREHFGITAKDFRVFEDFLEIVQHTKFDFDAFDDNGYLIPK